MAKRMITRRRVDEKSLELNLEEYYAAAGAIGLLAAQLEQPDAEWAKNWAFDFGERMAAEARRRRQRRRK